MLQDFYFNDLHGLKKVVEMMEEGLKREKERRKERMIEVNINGEIFEVENN